MRRPRVRSVEVVFEDATGRVRRADVARSRAVVAVIEAELGLARAPLDPFVARAVEAMRRDPAKPWTLAALARVSGLSRAPLARRFRRSLGTSPRQWLVDLRLRRAAEHLVSTDDGLAEVAVLVGYGSEFAFAKAFKRRYGLAPGHFRRRAHGAGAFVASLRAAA